VSDPNITYLGTSTTFALVLLLPETKSRLEFIMLDLTRAFRSLKILPTSTTFALVLLLPETKSRLEFIMLDLTRAFRSLKILPKNQA